MKMKPAGSASDYKRRSAKGLTRSLRYRGIARWRGGTCGKLTNQSESICRLCDSVIRAYWEFVVGVRVKKYPALKHGGYSATGLLPGEDRAAFEKLHLDLRAECRPDGPLEEHTVFDIARLLWRKQNLGTFRRAEAARNRYSAIGYMRNDWTRPTDAEVEATTEAAKARAREELRQELGEDYKFVELDDLATLDQLEADLQVEERLSAMIRKLVHELAILKTFKETLSSSKSVSAPELPRISGPKKAA